MMLSHDVYFTLHDDSPEAIERLVEGCHKYLKDHKGVEYFSAGTLGVEFSRPVNDRMFDVVLHVVFTDKAAHDAYQVDPVHNRFIEEFNSNWKQVRVFDAWVSS